MDFDIASQASAIDDSFFPVIRPPASLAEGDQYSEIAYCKGPRSGHWTVSSNGKRSGIDDRTPTLWDVTATSEYGSFTRVRRVDSNALRKLAVATEAERKAKQEGLWQEANQSAKQASTIKSDKVKGFYVPHLQDSRGIRIRSRDGKNEIVKDPTPKPKAPANPRAETAEPKAPRGKVSRPPSPAASVKSAAAASHSSRRAVNRIRIVGNNGQESFVELPFFSGDSKAARTVPSLKHATSVADAKPGPAPVSTPNPSCGTREKAKRDARAEKEAQRLRNERMAAEAKRLREEKAAPEAKRLREEMRATEAKRLSEEEVACEVMMHGALAASSRAASVAQSVKGSKSSSKVSEKQYPGVFDRTPVSVVSSTTSLSKSASVQQQSQVNAEPNQATSSRSKPLTDDGWQEVGLGTYDAAGSNGGGSKQSEGRQQHKSKISAPVSLRPTPRDRESAPRAAGPSRRRRTSNPASHESPYRDPSDHSKHWAREAPHTGGTKLRPSAATADSFPIAFPPPSNHPYSHLKQHSSGGFGQAVEGPTVFAGHGWISPHPLSEAPTWAREEPEPVIHLPPRAALRTESGIETMSYKEWLAVQKQTDSVSGSKVHTVRSSLRRGAGNMSGRQDAGLERRNFSRTSSHASRRYGGGSWGGSWGHRAVDDERLSTYRTPTVKTESEQGSSGQKHTSVRSRTYGSMVAQEVRDEDGNAKTQLKMPWDEQVERQASPHGSNDMFF